MTKYSDLQLIEIKRILPYILATAIFMQMLDSTILNTAIPAIARDLNESPLNMQGAIISYVLTLALFIPMSGFLADKFGTKKIFISSLITFSIGSILCAVSQNLSFLIFSRIVQGLGGALMTPVARLALIKTYPKNEFVKAMNYAIIPALIGPIIGPLIGGYIVEYISWHWIFLINIPFGLLGAFLAIKYMPDFYGDNIKLDFKGFLIFGIASILLSIGLEFLSKPNEVFIVFVLLFLGVFFLFLYYIHAKKQREKAIFPLNLFEIRTFKIGIIGNLVCRLGISSIPLLIPLLVQVAYKETSSIAGWIIAPMALTSMVTKTIVVPVIDYFGYRKILRLNTMMIGLVIIFIAFVPRDWSVFWFAGLMMVMGFFNSIQFTAMNTISIADLKTEQNSSGNSLLSVNQQLSMGFGIGIGLAVLRSLEAMEGMTHNDVHLAFKYTFIFMGIITIMSSFIFSKLNDSDGENLITDRASRKSIK